MAHKFRSGGALVSYVYLHATFFCGLYLPFSLLENHKHNAYIRQISVQPVFMFVKKNHTRFATHYAIGIWAVGRRAWRLASIQGGIRPWGARALR